MKGNPHPPLQMPQPTLSQPKKQEKIIQLTTPFERFQKFDQKADQALSALDILGELYADLGFRESDVEDYNIQQVEELKEELKQHAQIVLALVHHPIIAILREHRERAEDQEPKGIFEVPTGVWQHYKGARYRMYGKAQSTDFHAPAVLYSLDGQVNGEIYTITLSNFYRTVYHNREKVSRFTKVSD